MVTYADLREANTKALQAAGQAWWDHAESLREYEERMNTEVAGALVRSGWQGAVANVAVERSEQIEERFEIGSYAAELVASVYDSAYDRMWRLQWRLTVTVDSAHTQGLTVRDDGVVEAPPNTVPHGVDGGAHYAEQSRLATELTEQIAGIVSEADVIDQQTAEALASLNPEHNQSGDPWRQLSADADELASRFGLSEEDIPDDPAAAAAWWDRLSEAQQAMYLAAFPEQVGALDGLPVEDRDRANHLALHNVLASGIPPARGLAGQSQVFEAREAHERAQTLLDRLEASEYGPDAQQLYLLGFDLEDDGKAVISVGNPDTADHTAVYVPGTGTTIDKIGGDITRARNLQAEADRLTPAETGDVATVMWLGYDAPGPDLSAVRGHHAEAGAPALDSFVDGLRSSHQGDPGHLTVVGHSYGTGVIGEAASNGDGLAADDIITAGSPGMRVDNVEDLQLEAGHVWAGAADDEPVSGWMSHFAHGPEPHKEDFGANRFEADTTGHSDYWKPGTDSLKNQSRIVAGQYDRVGLEHGEPPR